MVFYVMYYVHAFSAINAMHTPDAKGKGKCL